MLVRQKGGSDCGPAALATVAAFHGCPIGYEGLVEEAALDSDGTDLLALSRIAEGRGFRTRAVEVSYDAIPGCQLPAIAHIRGRFGSGHFVVVHRWTPSLVVVGDPAAGLRTFSRRTFCRRSTGYLLTMAPAAQGDGSPREDSRLSSA